MHFRIPFPPGRGADNMAMSSSDPTESEDDFVDAPARVAPVGNPGQGLWNHDEGWRICFVEDESEVKAPPERAETVRRLVDFFTSPDGQRRLSAITPLTFAMPLDYAQLRSPGSSESLREAAAALKDSPDDVLACFSLAASRAVEILDAKDPDGTYPAFTVARSNRLLPRVYNFTPLTCMRRLRGNFVGKFIAVRGTVVRVSNTRQQIVSMNFECGKCGEEQKIFFSDFKYNPPVSCPTDGCRGRAFEPLRDSAETVDWQKIRIQELQDSGDDADREEGRMPRTIDAELFADLIDTCIPGDIVTLNGIARVFAMEGGGGGKNARNAKCLYHLYLEANSIFNPRNGSSAAASASSSIGKHMMEMETMQMHQLIRGVIQHEDPFGFLVHSTVPSIYGHEIVKAGMLLSLFGGAQKKRIGKKGESEESVSIRTDIHCIVVGDPGLGKSQMLKGISRIAPRGVYVCGNTTTTAGLTVTVVREAGGDFALEAGALVLSDRGVCVIDEFDKMGAEHGALLEAMEQQSVSVAKAGMLCNLSARTTVIAAANPVGGHYDRARTVCENLKIALPLLSRFDLVFILLDKPDEDRDRFISEHIMSMFGMRDVKGPRQRAQRSAPRGTTQSKSQFIPPLATQTQDGGDRTSLLKRLRDMRVRDPLPASVFRQYITYAKTHVHPELSEGAKAVLQDFYLTLRKGAKDQAADTTPITTRQLESLIRLAEARARAVMRTVVTADDARDIIEIMRESMLETLTDEHGTVDLGRASGMSRVKDAKRFIAALHAESERTRNALFDRARLKRIAAAISITGERLDTLIETINYQGYMMKKRSGLWQLQSSSFSQAGI